MVVVDHASAIYIQPRLNIHSNPPSINFCLNLLKATLIHMEIEDIKPFGTEEAGVEKICIASKEVSPICVGHEDIQPLIKEEPEIEIIDIIPEEISQVNEEHDEEDYMQIPGVAEILTPYKCYLCNKAFRKRKEMLCHVKAHGESIPVKCEICDQNLINASVLRNHMLKVHTSEKDMEVPTDSVEKLYECDSCGKGFKNRYGLQKHIVSHLIQRPYSCELCDNSFKSRRELNQHASVHYSENKFNCEICDKSIQLSAYKMKLHMQSHFHERPFKCKICKKGFKNQYNLKTHMLIHVTARFSCEYCEKTFRGKKELDQHVSTHKREKRYTCDICGKGYVWLKNLEAHTKTHTDLPHACTICDKILLTEVGLENHISRHYSKLPFKCNKCKKTFISSSKLACHKASKHEESYKCKICNESFKRMNSLNLHQLQQCYKSDFKCKSCGNSFNTKATLIIHNRNHCNEKVTDLPELTWWSTKK